MLPPLLIKLYEDYATRVPHSKHVNIVWISLLIIGKFLTLHINLFVKNTVQK